MSKLRIEIVGAVWRKEMLDIIRDRRTLLSMIVIPILLMPLLMLGGGLVVSNAMKSLEQKALTVAVLHPERSSRLGDLLAGAEQVTLLDLSDQPMDSISAFLDNGVIQAAVSFPDANFNDPESRPTISIYYREDREKSTIALRRLVNQLDDFRDSLVAERLGAYRAPQSVATPFDIDEENLATDEQVALLALASFLPYILILLTFTGALYPAIDMTAGEKERGTLETLLASPASRLEISLGKFLTVFTTAVISGILSVLSLMIAAMYGLTALSSSEGVALNFSVNPGAILMALTMMLPLAAIFSALLLSICVFAKSTREAQSYVQPLVFLIILPAMMSMMPGSEGTMGSAWTPVVNVSLAVKSILTDQVDPAFIGMTLVSSSLYAFAGIVLTARVFQRESALFRV